MSRGHWDYKEQNIVDQLIEDQDTTKIILHTVKAALRVVDYALEGDKSQEQAEKELFELFKKLGDRLYGE